MDGWIWIWRGWLERIDKWEEKGNRIRCPIQCLNAKVGPGVCGNKQSATREQRRVSMQEQAELWDYRNPFEDDAELNWAWVYSGGPQNQAQLQSWKLIVMQGLLKIPSANSSAIPTSINGSADTVSSIQLFHICKPLCNPLSFQHVRCHWCQLCSATYPSFLACSFSGKEGPEQTQRGSFDHRSYGR